MKKCCIVKGNYQFLKLNLSVCYYYYLVITRYYFKLISLIPHLVKLKLKLKLNANFAGGHRGHQGHLQEVPEQVRVDHRHPLRKSRHVGRARSKVNPDAVLRL